MTSKVQKSLENDSENAKVVEKMILKVVLAADT